MYFKDQQSKIDVVNKWIKEHKKYESIDSEKEENENKNEDEETNKTAEDVQKDNIEKKDDIVTETSAYETEDNDTPEKTYLKRRKSSRNLLKGSRRSRSMQKLQEVDEDSSTTLKTINIYPDVPDSVRQKILYKAFRRHRIFSILFYFAILVVSNMCISEIFLVSYLSFTLKTF